MAGRILRGESNLMNELDELLVASGYEPRIAGKFPSVSKGLIADVMLEVAVDSASADNTVLNSATSITPSEATYAAPALDSSPPAFTLLFAEIRGRYVVDNKAAPVAAARYLAQSGIAWADGGYGNTSQVDRWYAAADLPVVSAQAVGIVDSDQTTETSVYGYGAIDGDNWGVLRGLREETGRINMATDRFDWSSPAISGLSTTGYIQLMIPNAIILPNNQGKQIDVPPCSPGWLEWVNDRLDLGKGRGVPGMVEALSARAVLRDRIAMFRPRTGRGGVYVLPKAR